MRFVALILLGIALLGILAECNSEVDALHVFRTEVADPNNALWNWNPESINPCTWFHVTCNSHNSVTRLSLGSAGLSGSLVPQQANLTNLQYLELSNNPISGEIPSALGKLTRLVSLGDANNKLSGSIPASFGNLESLRWMRLNGNKLSGKIPMQVLELIYKGNLQLINVWENQYLAGTSHRAHKTRFAITTVIQDVKA